MLHNNAPKILQGEHPGPHIVKQVVKQVLLVPHHATPHLRHSIAEPRPPVREDI